MELILLFSNFIVKTIYKVEELSLVDKNIYIFIDFFVVVVIDLILINLIDLPDIKLSKVKIKIE